MTRFNITLDEGVDLVLYSFKDMRGGETYIPKMRSMKIIDLVKIFNPKKGFKEIGIRPGEKLHEELISKSDTSQKIVFKKYLVVLPSTSTKSDVKKYLRNSKNERGKLLKNSFSYNSLNAGNFLTKSELKKMISKL